MEAIRPGFVQFKEKEGKAQLDDLWFFVGSRCNLSCSHCYVGSNPTNDTLQQMTLEDITPFLEEAKEFGIKHIYFTGGEPFINKDMIKMIEACLKVAPVTILTNATFPIKRHLDTLKSMDEASENTLSFRISIDHYERDKHDAIRGKGMFDLTVQNTVALASKGFQPIITASAVVYENNTLSPKEIEEKFKDLFRAHNVDVDVKLLPFTLEQGTNLHRIKNLSKSVQITESCMERPNVKLEHFQCHNGRTIEKIDGKMIVYPCPIIYNDKRFELATNLKDSFKKVYLTHKSCYNFCYKSGGTCTN